MHRLPEELKVPHEYEELPGLPHDLSPYFQKFPARGLAFAAKCFNEPGPAEKDRRP
jgi:hypothetical protein